MKFDKDFHKGYFIFRDAISKLSRSQREGEDELFAALVVHFWETIDCDLLLYLILKLAKLFINFY